MSWTAFPFSREALAAALAFLPGAFFMTGCIENTNLTGSNDGTGGAGAGGLGGTGATGAAGGSSMGGTGGQADVQCGNGILEPGESCDDGNTMDGDACPASCLRPVTKLSVAEESTCAVLDDG